MRKTLFGNEKLGYVSIETSTKLKWIGFAFEIGDYEGDEITIGFYLGLYTIWLKYSHRRVYKLCKLIGKLHKARFTRSYNSHFYITEAFNISLELFGDNVGDDALYRKYIDIRRLIKGRSACEVTIIDQGETNVIMPEGAYPAEYTIEKRTWKYPRWFSKSNQAIEIKVLQPGGIPHEGKGENAWDCGMDGSISMHIPGAEDVRQATEQFAMSILKQRQRHSRLDKYTPYGMKIIERSKLVDTSRTGVA